MAPQTVMNAGVRNSAGARHLGPWEPQGVAAPNGAHDVEYIRYTIAFKVSMSVLTTAYGRRASTCWRVSSGRRSSPGLFEATAVHAKVFSPTCEFWSWLSAPPSASPH